jgi:hypothetical protein
MKMEWRHWKGQYTTREDLHLGSWRVGSVHLDGMRSKDDPLAYAATCLLPGLREDLGHFATAQEAVVRVEGEVAYWLRGAGVKP